MSKPIIDRDDFLVVLILLWVLFIALCLGTSEFFAWVNSVPQPARRAAVLSMVAALQCSIGEGQCDCLDDQLPFGKTLRVPPVTRFETADERTEPSPFPGQQHDDTASCRNPEPDPLDTVAT